MSDKVKAFEDACSRAARQLRDQVDALENGTVQERAAAIKAIAKVDFPLLHEIASSENTDTAITKLLEE